jgi:Skp family chaperone for outer membrane proteins
VAVMNMAKVLKGYKKFAEEKKRFEQKKEQLDRQISDIQQRVETCMASLNDDPKTVECRKKQVRDLKLTLAEKTDKRAEILEDLEDSTTRNVFGDIEAAARVYARARDIDLVIYFSRGVEPKERPESITLWRGTWSSEERDSWLYAYDATELRTKILSSGIPLYSGPEVDITAEVIHVLNWNYDRDHGRN